MSRFEPRLIPLMSAAAFAMLLLISPSAAQPGGFGWGPGMMMVPA
jgi:hypothetical protein